MKLCHLITALALAGFVLGPAAAQTQVIVNTSTAGTYGNDTAATLYLRPLNNAMLGTAYFGSGYPHSGNSSVTVIQPSASPSGSVRANEYLAATGWTAWQREKQALLSENAALKTRVQTLEQKLAELEARLRQVENANR